LRELGESVMGLSQRRKRILLAAKYEYTKVRKGKKERKEKQEV
jgi:hypothetical protein